MMIDGFIQLRIYLLTIPLAKIPPILVAAVPRGSKTSAESLKDLHFELINLLHEVSIHPVSLASDGTETERKLQRIINHSTSSHFFYTIPNPAVNCSVDLNIPLFHGYPSVIVQDSKHGLKTGRNQLFTGARMLVIGNFPCFYQQLLDFTIHPLGPLFARDVERVDRQDDRAAARLFSAECLLFLLCYHSSQVGLSVYLFIIGELIDAWQNRNIRHVDRVRMVLRARFFLMAWRSHIVAHPDHAPHIQFISRESYDIFLTLCDSLLSLIVIYRKFYSNYPLLPWLHSTEPCEHLFGALRLLKKDFNFSDVLYLEPKLRTLLLGSFGDLSPSEQANQTASGYHHTYFHTNDLDLAALMTWPSDGDIQNASVAALSEAEQLLGAVGIDAKSMLAKYTPPTIGKLTPELGVPSPPKTLYEIMQLYSDMPMNIRKEDEIETCELAIASEDIDKTMAM